MTTDLTYLNPMAHKMLPKDDLGLQTVKRLKKELTELSAVLPASQQAHSAVSSNTAIGKLGGNTNQLLGGGRRADPAGENLKKALHS